MTKELNFDLDGTLVNFYGVENWLEYLLNEDTLPYEVAEPLINMSLFARYIHKVQALGYHVNIISWGSKDASETYLAQISEVKIAWLRNHLPSIWWDEIHVVAYGCPKSQFGNGILFDDEINNRNEWHGEAYSEKEIFEVLKNIVKGA